MGGNPLAPGITGQEISRLRSLPSEAVIGVHQLHRVIDELAIMRRLYEGPKLPRDVASLQRAVEKLAAENDELRRALVNAVQIAKVDAERPVD